MWPEYRADGADEGEGGGDEENIASRGDLGDAGGETEDDGETDGDICVPAEMTEERDGCCPTEFLSLCAIFWRK